MILSKNQAGTCISAYSLAGFFINLILTRLIKKLGARMLGVCFTICAAGTALLLFIPSAPTALIGFALCGIGYFPVYSLLQLYNGQVQPADKLVFSSVIVLFGNQLAVFASSYYISICGNVLDYRNSEVSSSYLITIFMLLILAVIGFTGKIAPKENSPE